ncbi:hypothetical protein AAG570_008250, partial [Ranatra chinensis]
FNTPIHCFSRDWEQHNVLTHKILSRRSSFKVSQEAYGVYADDTFENILEVTSHHDAIMAFYYMDDNNKVKVTEIFDVTDAESLDTENTPGESGQHECDEPLTTPWFSKETDEDTSITDNSLDEECTESGNIFSDPESEWVSHKDCAENVLRVNEFPLSLPDSRPECEQVFKPIQGI